DHRARLLPGAQPQRDCRQDGQSAGNGEDAGEAGHAQAGWVAQGGRRMTASDEMTCEQFTAMAPAYALAILDETDRTACARHLAHGGPHRGCRLAVTEARQVTAR